MISKKGQKFERGVITPARYGDGDPVISGTRDCPVSCDTVRAGLSNECDKQSGQNVKLGDTTSAPIVRKPGSLPAT